VTAAVLVLAAGLALALALCLLAQRRTARRLIAAGNRLVPGVVTTGHGLAEATSLVERVTDRALLRDDRGSLTSARLADALAMLPQGIVVYDEAGTITFRNEVAAVFLRGRSGEALVEEAIAELALSAATGTEGAARTLELSGPPARIVSLWAAPLRHGGRRSGAVVVVDDITEHRRLEAVRRDFVANMSHELKTPVGALALLAETITAEAEPAVVKRLAERMLDESFRVVHLIDDLLELSSIESVDPGALGAETEVAVAALVAEALEQVRPYAERRRIELREEAIDPDLTVVGVHRQLVSALHNLLDNAVKYSEPGAAVELRTRSDGPWVDISVEDHGRGNAQRELDRVFERFYRVDPARSRDTGGTGLGLAIVRHVAQNHAGEVIVTSQEGEGSTFTLRLPAQCKMER
jgi:two-component system sensor histidine kinase SenX3